MLLMLVTCNNNVTVCSNKDSLLKVVLFWQHNTLSMLQLYFVCVPVFMYISLLQRITKSFVSYSFVHLYIPNVLGPQGLINYFQHNASFTEEVGKQHSRQRLCLPSRRSRFAPALIRLTERWNYITVLLTRSHQYRRLVK